MDAVETKITAILAAYATLTSQTLALKLGNLAQAERDAKPTVCWIELGGGIEVGRGSAGGNPAFSEDIPELGSMWAELKVEIWFDTLENARNCAFNIMAAARDAIDGPDLRFTRYETPTKTEGRHLHGGEIVNLYMSIRIPCPLEGTGSIQYAEINEHLGTYDPITGTTGDVPVDVDGATP